MTHDWHQTRQLLIAGSIPAIEAFFAVHPLSELRANTAQGLIDVRRERMMRDRS